MRRFLFVAAVRAREGDSVTRGQLVVLLDSRELADTVAQAEAEVEAAREGLAAAEIARAGRLAQQGSITVHLTERFERDASI